MPYKTGASDEPGAKAPARALVVLEAHTDEDSSRLLQQRPPSHGNEGEDNIACVDVEDLCHRPRHLVDHVIRHLG